LESTDCFHIRSHLLTRKGSAWLPSANCLVEHVRTVIDGIIGRLDIPPGDRKLTTGIDVPPQKAHRASESTPLLPNSGIDCGARSSSPKLTMPPLKLSSWARSLSQTNWPPVYSDRPRAFLPGLADEREFPHDVWARCLRPRLRELIPSASERTLVRRQCGPEGRQPGRGRRDHRAA
jgi:hypothetical protein